MESSLRHNSKQINSKFNSTARSLILLFPEENYNLKKLMDILIVTWYPNVVTDIWTQASFILNHRLFQDSHNAFHWLLYEHYKIHISF